MLGCVCANIVYNAKSIWKFFGMAGRQTGRAETSSEGTHKCLYLFFIQCWRCSLLPLLGGGGWLVVLRVQHNIRARSFYVRLVFGWTTATAEVGVFHFLYSRLACRRRQTTTTYIVTAEHLRAVILWRVRARVWAMDAVLLRIRERLLCWPQQLITVGNRLFRAIYTYTACTRAHVPHRVHCVCVYVCGAQNKVWHER